MTDYCVIVMRSDGSVEKVIGPIHSQEVAYNLARGYIERGVGTAAAQAMVKP